MNQENRLGEVKFEGDYATLQFERYFQHPPESVWKAITESEDLAKWYMTKARIDGRVGGTIDYYSGPSQFHVTGKILAWNPPYLFEHEWNVEQRDELPNGERGIIRWEILPVEGGSLLKLTHRHLTRQTSAGFAPGTHAFLDRLEAYLDHKSLPDWRKRVEEMRNSYLQRDQANF
jgi:uncharacterized protein YndB with AHSA1/START domain